LLFALIGLVTLALVVVSVVTYTQLHSFLVARLNPQLRVASYALAHPVERADHIVTPTDRARGSAERNRHAHQSSIGDQPQGTFGMLIDASGHQIGKVVTVPGSSATTAPPLPMPPPTVGSHGYVEFAATAPGSGGTYQILERPLYFRGLRVVVGIPLSEVDGTLNRLLLVELLVSGAVLLGLAGASWWIVRRGLRPLEDMADSAGKIASGELGMRVMPADDHTEVGRLGLALNAMLDEIEEAFAARAASEDRLRQFLADASHELRTPLTSIRGYSELFDLGAKANVDDLETSMRHIRQEADRMSVLVDDLLLLARLDRERPLDLQPTDIVPEITTAVETARHVSAGPRVVLQAPERLVIPCDAGRLQQVADNLLANALRHSPPGGVVEVTLRTVNGSAELSVLDHGPGVPAEQRERIFAPFHRSDFARSRSDGGVGLGLAIVAAIARAHLGTVGVRETPRGGADFWVRFPLASPGAALPVDEEATPSGNHQADEALLAGS
jgi:two-component system OmpR family sensor kinase